MVETTQAERNLTNLIRRDQVTTQGQLRTELFVVFETIYRGRKLEAFTRHVLPGLQRRYGKDYNAAAEEGLRIIQEGSRMPLSGVETYFQTVLTHGRTALMVKSDKRRGQKKVCDAPKPRVRRRPSKNRKENHPILRGIERTTNNLLRNREKEYAVDHVHPYNVCAVILFGGYVTKSGPTDDPLDLFLITRGFTDRHCDEFSGLLRMNLGVDLTFMKPIAYNDRRIAYKFFGPPVNDEYKIVSPFPPFKKHLEGLLQRHQGKS